MNDRTQLYDPQKPELDDNYYGYYKVKSDNLFHIGQGYEDNVAATLYCAKCGGKDFNVGRGDYYTAIRCIKCEWELCIHEG